MNIEMNGLINKINKHKLEIERLEGLIEECICETINEVGNEQKLNRISNHCFTVRYSDLVGCPWDPHFYDWKKSSNIVKDFLKNKPKTKWKSILIEKLNESGNKRYVIFDLYYNSGEWRVKDRVPISREFIQRILNKLDE